MRWPWSRRTSNQVNMQHQQPSFYFSNGRKVHLNLRYMLPADFQESNRLDFQHLMLRTLLKSNYLAPIRTPSTILDVACGTGRWGAEMARQYPHAQITGIDLTPPAINSVGVTLGEERKSDNYTILQGDITKGLPFANDTFDFVHMRLVFAAIPFQQWMPLVREIYRVTRLGGWVELVETSGSSRVPSGQLFNQWSQFIADKHGIDLSAGEHVGTYLKNAGLHNVRFIPLEIPIGPWGGPIGMLLMKNVLAVISAMEVPVVQVAKAATPEQFENVRMAMETEYMEMHTVYPFYIAFGQK